MIFYKADINIVDSKKVYGDLPENYTVGYENEETQTAYFPMVNKLDEKYVEVTEIDKAEYEQALSDINGLVRERRKVEFEETKAKALEKQKVIDGLNKSVVLLENLSEELAAENNLLKAQNKANADRAEFQEELIVELAMKVYQ